MVEAAAREELTLAQMKAVWDMSPIGMGWVH